MFATSKVETRETLGKSINVPPGHISPTYIAARTISPWSTVTLDRYSTANRPLLDRYVRYDLLITQALDILAFWGGRRISSTPPSLSAPTPAISLKFVP